MFEIVTDSSANLPNELIEKYRIIFYHLNFTLPDRNMKAM